MIIFLKKFIVDFNLLFLKKRNLFRKKKIGLGTQFDFFFPLLGNLVAIRSFLFLVKNLMATRSSLMV